MGSSKGGGQSGTTTSTTNTEPWAEQKPYLTEGLSEALGLYNDTPPQYYPYATYAPSNTTQSTALHELSNPNVALPLISRNSNADIAAGYSQDANPAYSPYLDLVATNSLEGLALSPYLSGDRTTPNNAATDALDPYLSGERMGKDNPYTDELTSNILSRAIPDIESRFISGGSLSSPEAIRSSSAGATSALAPYFFDREQDEAANQLSASNQYSGIWQNEADNQITAAGQSADTRLTAAGGLQTTWAGDTNDILRSIALSPATDAGYAAPFERQLTAGTDIQALDQQAIDDAILRWNYGEELPYNALNQYIGSVSGNYGGSSELTQPFFEPREPSLLSQVGSAAGTAASVFGMFGGW